MDEMMNAINEVMSVCRNSIDNAKDDYERGTLILSLVFNVARLAGEEGVSQQQVARNALSAVSSGYRTAAAQREAQGPSH
jgi:hypothetical protein